LLSVPNSVIPQGFTPAIDPFDLINAAYQEKQTMWTNQIEDEAKYDHARNVEVDPDVALSFEQLVTKYGCNHEEHEVTTDDFYNLKVFRVNYGNGAPNLKKTVFLQHGLFSDAATWVIHKEESLAFRLAKAGYDVWLGNNRGNIYSRSNSKISPDKNAKDFFNYSFYELGEHDVPAQIDYVR
jgi:lysosomal acid lipase/cholesteryl ester hydrolase